MCSLSAVVVRAFSLSYVLSGFAAVRAGLWSQRGRLILLLVVALPLIAAACGGKKSGHGSSWG